SDGTIALGKKGQYAVKVGDPMREIRRDIMDPFYGRPPEYEFPPFSPYLKKNSKGQYYINEGLTSNGGIVDATITFNFKGTILASIYLVDTP
uniref:hypothetical protein n=1 Tax=Parapedobacter tibetensis TaxID=2972951 RepID=UPI00214D63CE